MRAQTHSFGSVDQRRCPDRGFQDGSRAIPVIDISHTSNHFARRPPLNISVDRSARISPSASSNRRAWVRNPERGTEVSQTSPEIRMSDGARSCHSAAISTFPVNPCPPWPWRAPVHQHNKPRYRAARNGVTGQEGALGAIFSGHQGETPPRGGFWAKPLRWSRTLCPS